MIELLASWLIFVSLIIAVRKKSKLAYPIAASEMAYLLLAFLI